MIKFNFTLQDDEAEDLFDIIGRAVTEAKERSLEAAIAAGANPNDAHRLTAEAKWWSGRAVYLDGPKAKLLNEKAG